jgi:hypothetical protein
VKKAVAELCEGQRGFRDALFAVDPDGHELVARSQDDLDRHIRIVRGEVSTLGDLL